MRWFFVLLFLVNVIFFALMQWGGGLSSEESSVQPLAALNPEKIKLLEPPPSAAQATTAVAAVAAEPVVVPAAPVVPAIVVASAPVVASPVHATEKNKTESNCLEWGEFSGTDLARAETTLAQMKLGDKLSQRTVEYSRGYWVYIAPFKTHASRNKKIKQLKDLGIEDYFVVQEPGHWMNAISLGVFKTEEAAKNHLSELNKKGVRTAKVGERASKLKFTVFILKHMDAAAAAQLEALKKDYANSELKSVACNQ